MKPSSHPRRSPRRQLRFASALRSRLRTAEGREFIDFTASGGSVILGYADEDVLAAVKAAASRGLGPGFFSEEEARLKELLLSFVPFLDRTVMTASAPEALRAALTLARKVSGKKEVLFSGAAASADLAGGDLRRLPYGDLEAAHSAFGDLRGSVAAVVAAPIGLDLGLVEAAPGYLKGLRDIADAEGALLVFAEAASCFRFGLGAYASFCGVLPDLAVFGGVLGGGFPLGAFGGRRDLFAAPRPGTVLSGTVNPVALAAGAAALLKLERTDPYDRLEIYARRIQEELNAFAREGGLDFHVARCGGAFSPFFRKEPAKAEAEALSSDVRKYGMFAGRLFDRGWLVPASQYEPCFVSAAHADEEIDGFIEACRQSLDEVFETL